MHNWFGSEYLIEEQQQELENKAREAWKYGQEQQRDTKQTSKYTEITREYRNISKKLRFLLRSLFTPRQGSKKRKAGRI
ncbi:hypothetical protein E6C60_1103 [Paenibacillus algicola]|uniref:Uncharacterized protein n=1 Tax=Paenibacillus algicola TaxID=2565926 RepID=A0A4P8XK88_9BACL|nr:hypothetical protein [Paenibacillus algicola]QCT01821.1 hypothetical protein E6C60_1103 [Paenibacillus algicola]